MSTHRWIFATLTFLGVMAGGTAALSGAETLQKQLAELDRLRSGVATPFAEIEDRATKLLDQYPAGADQGRIHFQIAHSYAQGGVWSKEHTEKITQHARKALEHHLDPFEELRLYIYWGDALKMTPKEKPYPERRRAAALVYLKGLKEAQKYDVPDEYPKNLPATFVPPPDTPPEEFKRWQEAVIAEHEFFVHQREMFMCHQAMIWQLTDIYGRRPHAATQLRQLATEMLDDPDTVARLMNGLEEKGALGDDKRAEKTEKSGAGQRGGKP